MQVTSAYQQSLESEKLEALAEFAAGAGHEINNPLTVISGRAQLLLRGETDPERRHDLALIHSQALRVHEMIADLMLFARPPQPVLASVDLHGLLTRLFEELRPIATQRGIAMRLELLSEKSTIQVDAAQLLIALKALCDNAFNALAADGEVVICQISHRDNQVPIVVRDNGPGISPQDRRHLFDPFYSGRSAGRGLGMGLAKCWRIITNHGGQISVESDVGKGAKFTITLPKATLAAAPPTRDAGGE